MTSIRCRRTGPGSLSRISASSSLAGFDGVFDESLAFRFGARAMLLLTIRRASSWVSTLGMWASFPFSCVEVALVPDTVLGLQHGGRAATQNTMPEGAWVRRNPDSMANQETRQCGNQCEPAHLARMAHP